MRKLVGLAALVIAVILLLNPVALGIALNGAGTCIVLFLLIGGLVFLVA